MEINTNLQDRDLTISLTGRLDTTTAPQLEEVINANSDIDKLMFDLTNLEYISSAGLRVLFGAHKHLAAENKEMTIKGANADIVEVFEITGFSDIFKLV